MLSDVSSITAYLLYAYAANAKTQSGVMFSDLDHSCLGLPVGLGALAPSAPLVLIPGDKNV